MENNCLTALIQRFQSGEMSVFPVIFSEYKGLIYRYASKCCDEDTVEELSVFLLELLYKIDTHRFVGLSGDGLSRYIAVCIRNRYIAFSSQNDAFRKSAACADRALAYSEDFSRRTFLKDAIKQLTPRQQTVIALKYIYLFTDAEIALQLNISRQAVNRIKNRALEGLRKYYG